MRKIAINIPKENITAFCEKWQIKELALFGSVLSDKFKPQSDIDVLVTFHENAKSTLFDLVRMENELQKVFGSEVDLVSRSGIESSRNYLCREAILNPAETLYDA
jgi:predicted nucleotidyltransferase